MSTQLLRGHVDTIASPFADGRRRRRQHSPEFKAHVVAACCQSGASIASVALANGVNANLARRWVLEADAKVERTSRGLPNLAPAAATSFVPLQLPAPAPAASPVTDLRVEVTRGSIKIVVTWPLAGVLDCATLIRELLR